MTKGRGERKEQRGRAVNRRKEREVAEQSTG